MILDETILSRNPASFFVDKTPEVKVQEIPSLLSHLLLFAEGLPWSGYIIFVF